MPIWAASVSTRWHLDTILFCPDWDEPLRGVDPELTSAVKSGDTVTDERVGLFTPDKDRCTADGMGRAAVIAARRGTVCGEVGRVPGFPQLTVRSLYVCL